MTMRLFFKRLCSYVNDLIINVQIKFAQIGMLYSHSILGTPHSLLLDSKTQKCSTIQGQIRSSYGREYWLVTKVHSALIPQ